ncbi:PAS domain S-box protein [Haloplanus aerogenes]|nr:PAS domain S-box protein [Haloplanus aerogenes]RMB18075.1 PAS domain S-box-containing protein [Haloplanus aerogenes]
MGRSYGSTSLSRPLAEEPISVLHVDDEPDFAETAADFFEQRQARIDITAVGSATEGLEYLSEADVDCIVSDYRMAGMDGLEFLEAVREEYPDLPYILLTGKGNEDVASAAISKGVTEYLQKKPGADQFSVLANRIENVVDQTRAERRLEESQRRFQTLLDNVPGIVYRGHNDRGWPMRFLSDDCVELTGYEPSALVDGDVSYGRDIIHEDDRDRVWEVVQDALSSHDPFRIEYRIRTADGTEKWVREQGQGVFEDGDVVALEGFITDVTARKQSQRQREFQSSLLEAKMEATIDGLLVIDEDRTVASYNDQFVEMWEVPDEVIETKSDEALLDWAVDNKLAEPEDFLTLVEDLYDHPDRTSRDEVRLTDGRVFDRYSAPVVGDDGTNYGRLWVFRDITERTEYERELERQEFLFSRVQEIASIGIWEYDPQSGELIWSDGIRRIHGVDDDYEPTLAEGIDFYHPDDRDEIEATVTRAIEECEGFNRELRIVRPDGDVRNVRTWGEVSTDEHGATEVIRGVFQDITDRKEREEQLQTYEYVFESALSALAIAGLDGELRSVNAAFCEMWGYEDCEDLLSQSVTDFWTEPEAAANVVDAIRETGRWEGGLQGVREDGTTFDTYCSASTVTDDDGDPIALMSSFVDVTERNRHEQKLAEEREKYATLVEQSHDGIAIIQDGAFVFVNSRLSDIVGYEESDLLGMPIIDLITPKSRELVQKRHEQRLDPGADDPPSQYTLTFETADGRERVGEVSAAVIQYEGAPAVLTSVRDVTERQQYEDELERVNEELEVLNRVVRHDIRNDMTVILGWAEMLGEHVDDDGKERLETILTGGKHVVELTEIARDYVETLTGDGAVDVKPVQLDPMLRNEIMLRREAYPDADIVVEEPIPDVGVQANEMLSSVFRNLLNNAVQHNDKDRPVVEVTIRERADEVEVTVADNGPGVPESQRETIFGKGEMGLDSGGTGIGLYLVHTLVKQYGGDVRVEDNDPEGAAFTVTLPRAG